MAVRSYNGRNLIAGLNGDFENAPPFVAATTTNTRWVDGTATGSVADDTYKWHFVKDSGTVSAQFDSAEKYSGRFSIKVDATDVTGRGRVLFGSNNGTGASQTVSMLNQYAIRVRPGATYNLSYWAKSLNLAGNGQISVHQHNSNGTRVQISQPAGSITGTTDWTLKTANFTVSQSAAYLIFSCELGSAGIQTLWFDDISLTEVLPARTTITTPRATATQRVAVRDMGTALRFGASAGATVVSDSSVMPNFSTTSYTVSAWAKAPLVTSNVAADQQTIFGSSIGNNPYWYITLRNSNYLLRYQDASEDRQVTTPQRPNQPVHLTAVLDKTLNRIILYVNGLLINSSSVTSWEDLTSELLAVGFIPGQTSFKGIIDEPRIWNRALTASEIANMYFNNIVPRTGLVAEYLFNEASGSTALDTSGNGNNGTITGATYTTDVPLRPRTSV